LNKQLLSSGITRRITIPSLLSGGSVLMGGGPSLLTSPSDLAGREEEEAVVVAQEEEEAVVVAQEEEEVEEGVAEVVEEMGSVDLSAVMVTPLVSKGGNTRASSATSGSGFGGKPALTGCGAHSGEEGRRTKEEWRERRHVRRR